MDAASQQYHDEPVRVLTVAGSDSGGAAGLQADLKTFTALRAYGMSVVTVVTAQNSQTVSSVLPMPPALVEAQLDAVLADYGAQAIKTGFIGRADLLESIASRLAGYRTAHLVVDPVLVNHRGQSMFPEDVTRAYIDQLLPLAELLTPNPEEAALLSGRPLTSLEEAIAAAAAIRALGPAFVLLKGFRDGDQMVDVLLGDGQPGIFRQPVIATDNTHGSGDTLSAAVCVFLARGQRMTAAVENGLSFTHEAIRRAAGWHLGSGHGPVGHF